MDGPAAAAVAEKLTAAGLKADSYALDVTDRVGADAAVALAASRTGGNAARSTLSRTSATGSGTGAASQVGIAAEQIDRAERALTRAIGPIAKLLVKRALPGAGSEAALWEKLAGHIDRPADRDAFLKQRPR